MNREELELALQAHVELMDRRFAQDPWFWFCEMVETKDEATQQKRKFPGDKIYLKDLTQALVECPMLAIPKSRRMFATWLVSLWCLYKARYSACHAIYWQSETETKAAFVVDQRCKYVEDNIAPLFRRAILRSDLIRHQS